jgi:hypothetical protein
VQQYGVALQPASKELRAAHDIVLAAVQQHGLALQFASEELRADHDIALAAGQQQGNALQHASEELCTGREWTLASNIPVAVAGTSAPTLTIRDIVIQEGDGLRLCGDMMCGDKVELGGGDANAKAHD